MNMRIVIGIGMAALISALPSPSMAQLWKKMADGNAETKSLDISRIERIGPDTVQVRTKGVRYDKVLNGLRWDHEIATDQIRCGTREIRTVWMDSYPDETDLHRYPVSYDPSDWVVAAQGSMNALEVDQACALAAKR
ncbi:hypothetical protein [Sphingomonas oryzagri]